MRGLSARHLPLLLVAIFSLSFIGCGTEIPSGHRGVFYSKFGDGTEFGNIYGEGFAWHLPWNSMIVRSEEHMSELQSRITISYAVFCWKKTNSGRVMLNPNKARGPTCRMTASRWACSAASGVQPERVALIWTSSRQ